MEEDLGIPTTEHFRDLDKESRYVSSEMNFLKFIVIPLVELADNFMEGKMEEERALANRNMEIYSDRLMSLETADKL